jgi:hypothetical protein
MNPPAAHFEFRAKILISGINPYVDIPPEVSREFGKRGNVHIKGSLNELPVRGTLVPVGGGRHRLYINGDMRKKTGTAVGDEIALCLEFDDRPRDLPVPPALRAALDAKPEARAVFDGLPPSRHHEFLAYLNYLKTPEALERNVKKVILKIKEQRPKIRDQINDKT